VLYSRDPERHEYPLTDAGCKLFGAIISLMRWGEHLPIPRPPIVLRHNAYGRIPIPG
jgi:DNA-binding HxlR family transcriptional regulator